MVYIKTDQISLSIVVLCVRVENTLLFNISYFRDELLAAFPKLELLLLDWKNAQLNLQQTETELQDACQEKALLEEALLNQNHNLYTLPKRL